MYFNVYFVENSNEYGHFVLAQMRQLCLNPVNVKSLNKKEKKKRKERLDRGLAWHLVAIKQQYSATVW